MGSLKVARQLAFNGPVITVVEDFIGASSDGEVLSSATLPQPSITYALVRSCGIMVKLDPDQVCLTQVSYSVCLQ